MSVTQTVVCFEAYGSTLDEIYSDAERRLRILCGFTPDDPAWPDVWRSWAVSVELTPSAVKQDGDVVWYQAATVARWQQ